MRIAVLVLAGLGVLTSGGLGFKWFTDSRSPQAQIAMQLGKAAGPGNPEVAAAFSKLKSATTASYFLMLAAILAGVGIFLVLKGMGLYAGITFIAAVVAPTVLVPMSLVFTSPLLVAGGLSFLLGPKEETTPKRRGKQRQKEEEEEEQEEQQEEQEEENEEEDEPIPSKSPRGKSPPKPAPPAPASGTRLTCPSCGATLKTAQPLPAGKRVKCPKCSKPIVVPESD